MRLLTIFFLFVFISCNTKKVLPLNTMRLVIWEMACADEMVLEQQAKDTSLKKNQTDSLRKTLYQKVFSIHKISKDEFYTSYNYYLQKPDVFKTLIDSVQSYGLKQREKLNLNPPLTQPIP